MAIERLQRALPEVHSSMDFVPFWEPDLVTAEALRARGAQLHYAAMSKAKHLYILQDTKRLAASLGLEMVWPVDVDPFWEPSHLGWLKARRLGCGPEFYKAVVTARWRHGENISDLEVIGRLAASIGLDASQIAMAIDDPDIRAEGVDCLVRAYQEDIFGVPYFRNGRERYWGFDRLEWFLRSLRSVPAADASDASLTMSDAVYDTDTAGGCG
jgi:2-hydroxychromene-2-carboxylate isomerase